MTKIKYFIVVLFSFLFLFFSISFINNYLPDNETLAGDIPSSHFIAPNIYNPLEKQGPYMCSGYSASFVKQYYNLQADASNSYQQMSYSIPFFHGVPPFRLVNHLNTNQFNTSFYRGTLRDLFFHVSEERPVIVLVGEGLSWQHYLVLVGYDIEQEKIYFYNPEQAFIPENNIMMGNNTRSFDEFKKIWANGLPIYNHLYIPANLTPNHLNT